MISVKIVKCFISIYFLLFAGRLFILRITVDGMFAPRRPKQRIYPTLRSEIETKRNLISQKVGRKIYRMLCEGFYFVRLIILSKSSSVEMNLSHPFLFNPFCNSLSPLHNFPLICSVKATNSVSSISISLVNDSAKS